MIVDSEGSDIEVEDLDDSNKDIDLNNGLWFNKVNEKDGTWLRALVVNGSENEANWRLSKRMTLGWFFDLVPAKI